MTEHLVTDIKALAIRIAKPQRVVHTDEITQAQTTHYTLEIDVPSKAVSFDEAERVRRRKTGAFFRQPEERSLYSCSRIWTPNQPRERKQLPHLCSLETRSGPRQFTFTTTS